MRTGALLEDVGDDRTLDAWAQVAGMPRRTFMRALSAQVGMSFGRWRQQARLFAALEMLAQRKSVTEVAIAVGYDSVSAFNEMFRTMLGNHTTDILSRQARTRTQVEPEITVGEPISTRLACCGRVTGNEEVTELCPDCRRYSLNSWMLA